MSTHSSKPDAWLIRPSENPKAVAHVATRIRWIECGDRNDYALVELVPPLDPIETGDADLLTLVVLAPRHSGFNLRADPTFPLDVYVTTLPELLKDATVVPPDALKIRLWATLIE